MLKVHDKNGNYIRGIVDYKEARIEQELNITDTLLFRIPKSLGDIFEEEGYVGAKEGRFVIKEKNLTQEGYEIVGKYDLEELLAWVESKSYITMTIQEILEDLLIDTDWTVISNGIIKRTVTGTNLSILELIYKAVDTFRYEIKFDNVRKIIYVDEELGSDKGVYFHDEVNLKSLNTTSDTYDFATRLIPIGFDGMGIEFINDGIPYVENHTYSDKIITQIWQDERYTVIENLKEDAEKRLAKIAKPLRSYSADVNDLSRNAEYEILSYEVGDIITLIDKESGTREKQRIVKKVKYLDEVGKDTVEIANRPRYLGDEQEKIIENLRTSFNITRASLELFEDSIVGKVTEIEGVASDLREDYEGNKIEVDARITENVTETQQLATEISDKVSQKEYDRDYNLINENFTEVRQEVDSIKNTIQIGGGNNLIKNSVGYGELNYWVLESGEVDYGFSTWILEGTSKHGWIISDGVIYQDIDLLPHIEHTLSGRLLKNTEAGIVSIGLYDREADDLIHEVIRKEVETFDGQFSFQFSSGQDRNLRLKIEVENASTVNPVELTDLMLAQGVNYDVWSQASGEIYTLNVKMDGKGITVFSADNRGRTVMSPEEFAGYYNNQKIFTLNGDITEVMGLKIGGKGLFIPPVKFVQTQNSLDVVWTGR